MGNSQTGWTLQNQTPIATSPYTALFSTAAALSRVKQARATFQQWMNVTSSVSTGPYNTVSDQVVFQMVSSAYTRLITIPGPNENIFVPGTTLVDLSRTDVSAFLSEVFSLLGDTYGNPWIECVRGYRRKLGIG